MTLRMEDHDGWYTIERDQRRITNADVEGTADEMLAIAKAITDRDEASFRRCAVNAVNDPVTLWSPRNSMHAAEATRAEAVALAKQIIAELGPKPDALAWLVLEPGEGMRVRCKRCNGLLVVSPMPIALMDQAMGLAKSLHVGCTEGSNG